MNPLTLNGSSTTEDPENFMEDMKIMFDKMHVVDVYRVELVAY